MDFSTALLIAKALSFGLGAVLVLFTLSSAVRMLVLPRSDNVLLTRVVFLSIFALFSIRLKRAQSYEERDQVMAFFAPVALLLMPIVWVMLTIIGYSAMYWALGVGDLYSDVLLSGSSLLTLGFAPVQDWPTMLIAFSEATIGLGLVALVLAYLPTMYSAFSRREKLVAMLEVRAGSPPSAVTMILRYSRNQGIDKMTPLWEAWEEWFAEVEESHTSLAPLIFFRSPRPEHSWITAAGAVLDTAALMNAVVDLPVDVQSRLCLRRIADFFFNIEYNPNPTPTDPISITREEFDEACEALAEQGVPLVADHEQAWRDFVGWRVNYDVVLLALARRTLAPYAPWSSDRSLQRNIPQKTPRKATQQ